MMPMSPEEIAGIDSENEIVIRAEALATSLGTLIPSDIQPNLWSVPILEALLERIKYLEGVVNNLESAVSDLGLEEGR